MIDLSIGAVGAAIIAAVVSLVGLIIGKEQKISEFRQAWINDLRKCLIDYLVHINAISDALRVMKSQGSNDKSSLLPIYKGLNEASHGIVFRINDKEKPAKALIGTMAEFETIAQSNGQLTPDNIKVIEKKFIKHSKRLLKFEWNRVKRGEKIFVLIKWASLTIIVLMTVLATSLWIKAGRERTSPHDDRYWLYRTVQLKSVANMS